MGAGVFALSRSSRQSRAVRKRDANKTRIPRSQSHLLRPEDTSFLHVLQVVPDDVGLLEEQTHGVGQFGVLAHLWVLQLRGGEELRQTDPDQPCHIVTILQGIKQSTVLCEKVQLVIPIDREVQYYYTVYFHALNNGGISLLFTRSHSFMDPTFFSRNSAIPTPIRWHISEMTSL